MLDPASAATSEIRRTLSRRNNAGERIAGAIAAIEGGAAGIHSRRRHVRYRRDLIAEGAMDASIRSAGAGRAANLLYRRNDAD